MQDGANKPNRSSLTEVGRKSTNRSPSIDRRKSTIRTPRIKDAPDASNLLTQQLNSRLSTSSSADSPPDLGLKLKRTEKESLFKTAPLPNIKRANHSLFHTTKIDKSDKSHVFLKAKKVKINPGIPMAEIHKTVGFHSNLTQTGSSDLIAKAESDDSIHRSNVIPPIPSKHVTQDTSITPVESEVKKNKVSQDDIVMDPASATDVIKTPFDFFEFLKENPTTLEYVYLVPVSTNQKGQSTYNPYNLKIVGYFDIDTSSNEGYYTLSALGVTHINNTGKGTFTPLQQWVREHELYHKLLSIPFFNHYRKWKCFTLWKSTVLHAKIQSAKRNLEKNLFILHPILRTSLLKINSLNKEIILEKKLVYTPKQTTMELADFVREQKEYVETVTTASLKPWEQTLRVVVEDAAQKTLQARGFEIESPNSSTEPRKMTFTEQASRRGECRRLTRFVKLIDYMIVSTMQMLVINSVQELMKFSFAGCENDDVVIDNAGTGTVVINEHGIIQDSVEQTANSNNALENVHPSSSYISVQVGGVVVGKEVFTSRLAECGFDGFSDILSRLVKAAVPVIELVEVIEEEGPLLDKNDSFVEVSEIIVPSRKAEDVSKWKNNDKPKTFVPIFRTELLMNHTNQSSVLYFVSSLNDYLSTIDILLKVYLSTVEQINQITNTIYFLDSSNVSGGSYSAVRSLDELEFGDGPQVSQIILEGAYFKELCGRIRGVFVGMFGNASKWLVTLEPLKDMWVANQSFDALGSLRENVGELAYMLATSNQGEVEGGVAGILLAAYNKHIQLKAKKEIKIDPETGLSELEEPEPVFNVLEFGSTVETDEDGLAKSKLVDFFDKTLKKFANEKEIMSAIPTTSIINNLMIDSTNLKRIFVPSPERCFDEVSRLLPEISRDKNELLLTEVQSWLRILSTHPSSVESFVEYLGWLEKIRLSIETVSLLESEITQLYGILDQNKIFLLPTDVAMYQTLAPTLRTLKEQVDIAYDSKDDNISKFTVDLEKMLGDLSAEVSEIRNSAQDPMVLSASSNNDEVIGYLDELKKKLDKVEQLKITYENWGALFKRGGEMVKPVNPADAEELQGKAVQSTDNVELDETKKEVEMKTSLWTSLKDWDVLVAGWVEQSFETLVTDDINTKITQFLKISYNLDKGLPPNEVVPKLKLLVEGYRKIYPTIVDLRNPSLKARHWEKIQDSVGKVLPKYETFTLGFLLENHVFDFKDEIGHISSQAGSEASLDEMLTKVVKLWNDAEFIVTPYRDSKDVFILGTVEDIQTLLEDSQVTIATIKSSRFIGPIKGEVERWDKMLSLFAETLDAWLVCQRSWLYLESIFAAPDIQRQLPNEAKMFSQVDRSWKELMRKVAKNPNPLKSGTVPGVLETLQQNNILLEQIQKCLEDYLESKRLLFPRFYFLSNDELLEILSQTKNPQAVQPHLSKCFDAIKNLEFGSKDPKSIDIVGMNSPEGEKVPFIKTIKARGNVEGWLGNVEEAMVAVLRRLIKVALSDYKEANRNEWVKENVGQVVLTGNQVLWSKDVGDALKSSDPGKSLLALRQKSLSNLSGLATLVRGELTKIQRAVLGALITIDVHNRDIIAMLIASKVTSNGDFEWTKQQRYYWDIDSDTCHVKMSTSVFFYGYEYLGCSARLVITPLTDRCYLTLTGAMQLNLGGSPVGPAGTGKTETVKDLAKALAKQCVVFNCSDGMDYKMMGKMFSGLAQSGAWCCFDEFNRIDIEVLSVIAQQLLTIKTAKDMKATRFIFEGREIRLIETCAAFITMNPGYAGRTELPDNLKALFRPISMMIPDYGLIAEIMLFSEGFEDAKGLAGKVVNLYKLCSEQLSQQDHYDFGMRAVKSVLIMAGALKRSSPDLNEEVVLIRSLRDSNLPKFLSEDIGLFKGILSDLFPGVIVPERDFGTLVGAVKEVMIGMQMEIVDPFVSRICQLAETMRIRHGVMLVGPTGGGKTSCYQILQNAMTNLSAKGNKEFDKVKTWVLNPKCVSMTELYGEFNLATMEWKDGLIGTMFREQVSDNTNDEKWTVCDGPVDALWIENMNTVLDDNKLLTLINGERIKMTPTMHMLFEVGDLAVASPATVSRCGMVYMDSAILGWTAYAKMWIRKLPEHIPEELREYLYSLFVEFVDRGIQFVKKNCKEYIKSTSLNLVISLTKLIYTFLKKKEMSAIRGVPELKTQFANIFVFSYVWSIGGNISDASQESFDTWFREYLESHPIQELRLPALQNVFSYYIDHNRGFVLWEEMVPTFKYSSEIPYFQMIVPTVDTIKFSYLLEALLINGLPTLFCGESGVGKSVIVQDLLNRIGKQNKFLNVILNFSAQTTSVQTQRMIENKIEKKRKNISGPPMGFDKVVMFIDDLNMPKLDTYGSQPSIELFRQYLDYSGFYDREKLFWKEIEDVYLIAACAPPGGGRNQITPRFLRHFNMLNIPSPSEVSLGKIFKSIVEGFFKPFTAEVKSSCEAVVNSSIEIYHRMCHELLPTPAKSHYTFNLRDLSKVIQGILQVKPLTISTKNDLTRLFCHESLRVFHDRLIDDTDRKYYNQLLSQLCEANFGIPMPVEKFITEPIMFCDFAKRGVPLEDRIYCEISDMKFMNNLLEEYLEEYNVTMNKEMRLIFFLDAKQHVTRISRIIRQPRGSALLVGVGGTGKQSLTRLACHIADFLCIQIELTRTYGTEEWNEDLRKVYRLAGVEGKNTVFLLSDTQIKNESFLEDINNILNSGEVPNLIDVEEREKILGELRPIAREKGLGEDRDSVYQLFISRVRDNLHIVLGTSPVGDTFRDRCRMFPSLVNCCTIDWFDEWPKEALLSVSSRFLEFVDLGSDEMKGKISKMCVEIHSSVGDIAKKFDSELRRRYYTTPTSYLELINIYVSMLSEKRKELGAIRDRLKNGLNKLAETNELVANMQVELNVLGPELKIKAADTEELMIKIGKDQESADAVRKVVSEEETIVREVASQTEAIANDAQRDLDAAVPALESAFKALDSLEKKDIAELKVFSKPPDAVLMVLEAICILFKCKPDWENSKKLLGDSQFMKKMQEYDKDTIPEAITKKLKKYVEMPAFTPDAVARVSQACKSMCMWVLAMELYSRVFKEVAPKRKRLEEAQQSLEATREKLAEKTAALEEVEIQLDKLKSTYESSVASKRNLLEKMEETTKRLGRANKLTTALADEQVRWTESVESLNVQINSLVGNIFLSAASVAYYGAFTSPFRAELTKRWILSCQELGIPVSENFSLVETLSDPAIVREWNTQGLPADSLSSENGLLVTKGRRWPLMIDPQGQANRWIRNMSGKELKVIKLSEPKFLRSLENAVRTGQSVLIEDVGETLDPALEPLLLKQTFRQGGRVMMKLGDSLVEYDRNFKLYITTKLQNPHYLPEVSIKVTIINFTVTKIGLEGQLLADVVKLEKPELEEQRNSLIVNIANDKKQLKDIEDKILKLLFNSQGNILDDEELINTLNQSKITSATINNRLAEAQETEVSINTARERYRPVSIRGSILYFVIADLAEIDPMYHFSLKYFKTLFLNTIKEAKQSEVLATRIKTLCTDITFDTFSNVSRALFENHKLLFAYLICVEVMRGDNIIDDKEWNFFLRGSGVLRNKFPAKPNVKWITEYMWKNMCDLAYTIPQFEYTLDHILTYPTDWEALVESDEPYLIPIPGDTISQLTDLHKLLLVKVLREEKLVPSCIEFVKRNLGSQYIDIPPLDLAKAYKDTTPTTPLIFILSTGSDPVTQLKKFAGSSKMNMGERLQMISLGQGQGPIAEEIVRKALRSGDWVFLQNCHLAASWMNRLETIVKENAQGDVDINTSFRLILSSMPSKVFPISVLQESVKVTNEPPKGLRANLARSFADIPKDLFDDHPPQGVRYRKMLFGVCFFNAIIHERKKFGPLGWNILYDWSNSDLEVSCTILSNMLQEQQKIIPWEALLYLTGEIAFGGRVTDDWDRRALKSILSRFYSPSILDDNYRFSPSGIYFAPPDGEMSTFKAYIDGLPFSEEPSVFGMHENANISYQLQEARRLLRLVLEVQPRMSTGATGMSSEDLVLELAQSILADWPEVLILDPNSETLSKTLEILFKKDSNDRMLNSLSTVLCQESSRFNKLNFIVKSSLENLCKAVKGLIVMSADLELVFNSLLNNAVPTKWANNAYPSLKGLASWVKDFHRRTSMISKWAELGQPKSFWLPGFFFPQGFLTGVLQNHARKYNIPIDSLKFSYEVKNFVEVNESVNLITDSEDGALMGGLFLEGARWDREKMLIQDSFPMEMFSNMPLVQFIPVQELKNIDKCYACPLYKTSARAGTLSTTGQSTNFVATLYIPSDKPADYWISKGAAILCQLNE